MHINNRCELLLRVAVATASRSRAHGLSQSNVYDFTKWGTKRARYGFIPTETTAIKVTFPVGLRQQAATIADHMRDRHAQISSDEECVFEYARFLLLKIYMGDVWHAHMLRPHLYMRLCEELGMGVIAHDPVSALDIDNHNKRLAKTTTLYSVMFGEEAGRLWHEDAGHEAALLHAVKLEAGNATSVKTAQTKMNVCGEEELRVFVKDLNGKTYAVYAHATDMIDALKARIQDSQGIPIDQQRIIFAGKQLEDDWTLEDCRLVDQSTVHLVLREDRHVTPSVMVLLGATPASATNAAT
eukprot:gene4521-14686_t